jgi:hypothetical protein
MADPQSKAASVPGPWRADDTLVQHGEWGADDHIYVETRTREQAVSLADHLNATGYIPPVTSPKTMVTLNCNDCEAGITLVAGDLGPATGWVGPSPWRCPRCAAALSAPSEVRDA